MPKIDIEIINKLGLHARASAKLSQLASEYPCEVFMSKNGRRINANIGSIVTIETVGEKEDDALKKICELIQDRFGEGE
ncbi:MAG: hypothetical protein RL350_909 [Pseudomonadota bacterium]